MIKRLYVEKKDGFNTEASRLMKSLGLSYLRVLNRYDIEFDDGGEWFEKAKNNIFSEPMIDFVYKEIFPVSKNEITLTVEYLPGQYDQRADSAVQCVGILTGEDNLRVTSAKTYVFDKSIGSEKFEEVKKYIINPIDSRIADDKKPETLVLDLSPPHDVESVIGFRQMTEPDLKTLSAKMGLAMSLEDSLFARRYFRDEIKRDPTVAEIRIIDTYWSDHCRHTTFLTSIENVKIADGAFTAPIKAAWNEYLKSRDASKDLCLMDVAVAGMKELRKLGSLDDIDESHEINACSIKTDIDIDGVQTPYLIMFKNETHNHPTEIEPFGGAATCLGGAIRDPLSGRAYVYQAMRVTGSGNPLAPIGETIAGKLPQRKITTEAARGFSSYGNQIGLATGHVAEIYDDRFVAKRMEIGATVGAAPAENVVRAVPQDGDAVILLGGRTGRDGCGGATGSSKSHDEQSIALCGSEVQKGNPITERKIQRLFRKKAVTSLIRRCNDFGAGGVCVAVGELADGLDINLDLVTKKYEGLDGTELAISESQERMAVVVSNDDAKRFISLCNEENLEAAVIARVTNEKRLRMTWRGKRIADIPRTLLASNGAKRTANAFVEAPDGDAPFKRVVSHDDLRERWLSTLKRLDVCSQKGLAECFDSTIGAGCVLMPFGGETQKTPAELSVTKIAAYGGETDACTMLAHSYFPEISKWSPFHGAVYAVVGVLAKITAAGGDFAKTRLSLQEYFEKLHNDPIKWGKPLSGLLGAYVAQKAMGTAAIGGKDSMSGTFKDISVPPVVAAFGLTAASANAVISPEFKRVGSNILFFPIKTDEYFVPDFEYLKRLYAAFHQAVINGVIISAHTIKSGGVCEAVSKMCFGNEIGVKFEPTIDEETLFAPRYGSLVAEIAPDAPIDLFDSLYFHLLAKTQSKKNIDFSSDLSVTLAECLLAWEETLESVFASKPPYNEPIRAFAPPSGRQKTFAAEKFARPRVLMPVFPGTNCEKDTRRAFEKAGAFVEEFVFKNLTVQDIATSVELLTHAIDECQILSLPGGFSAGDEPDGSAKFIAAAFRNDAIAHSVTELLKKRGGLILGICNGFQALVKLGLVTYGEITDMRSGAPTLTYNSIGRHISRIALTKVVSTRSPWLYGLEPGDARAVPISHGEGRFVATDEQLAAFARNDQIATLYDGDNPNGSAGGIEGLVSPCGAVFGKMGHSERIGENLYKNIPFATDQKIFESGVRFFQ
ncbi:MAG: phosphoribosylformylglycinamidine synthase [Clostridiales bacterium]|jgi:phosphoribosylformylglycinamidine synthase|nr:phosphoribosylformylglycinamidine synthase [Clostridiales bacterium]